ncbi:MAG: neutral/alkaline non-lysosomal ceramidase N-terminal domain-containing protein [Anaerolineae bacterium]|nr:neutral/alkaline non-lysosomal ceramidase N-terminal domain-containing protein [Anaerolineae bacterium]
MSGGVFPGIHLTRAFDNQPQHATIAETTNRQQFQQAGHPAKQKMSQKSLILYLILWACVAAISSCKPPEEPPRSLDPDGLKVGAAVVDITPDETVGMDLAGYGHRSSTGVHDPITARCLVIDDGNTEIALIALDFSNLAYSAFKKAASEVGKASGIPAEHIFVHAIHTHSGPSLEYYGSHPKAYKELLQKITQCVISAKNGKEQATAAIGKGTAVVDTINRDYPDRKVENDVNVIEFRDSEKEMIAVLVNFACHPVVLGPDNLLMSADYVHFLRESLEETLGGTAIFFSGSLGDINPQPVNRPYIMDRTGGTFEMARDLGNGIADGVRGALQNPEPLPIEIKIAGKELKLREGKTKIAILALGDVWIVTIPGEPFSTFQQELESALPVSSLATKPLYFGLMYDRIGYIMPEDEWEAFIQRRPDEAHDDGGTWAATLESEYRLLADEMLK